MGEAPQVVGWPLASESPSEAVPVPPTSLDRSRDGRALRSARSARRGAGTRGKWTRRSLGSPSTPPASSRGVRSRLSGSTRGDSGQATVEFAAVLLLVVVLVLLMAQVLMVAQARVAVEHAARAGVRELSVGSSGQEVDAAIKEIDGRARLASAAGAASGGQSRVTVELRVATDVPIVGALLPDVTVSASASARTE
jgi:hypothetical protein